MPPHDGCVFILLKQRIRIYTIFDIDCHDFVPPGYVVVVTSDL